MEAQIPIPSLPDGSPDFSIVSKAWWDAIDLIEKSAEAKIYACDMALELRIMGGSDVTMAPQFGNKHGTLSIEPVSTRMVHEEVWEDFKEELAEVWMSYKDFDGTPLNTRYKSKFVNLFYKNCFAFIKLDLQTNFCLPYLPISLQVPLGQRKSKNNQSRWAN